METTVLQAGRGIQNVNIFIKRNGFGGFREIFLLLVFRAFS